VVIYARAPSFPTPDKLLVFLTLVFMAWGQGWELFRRLAPFAVLLLAYDSFRGIADKLNSHVNYQFMIHADRWLGGGELPTVRLQRLMWHGRVEWYTFAAYLFYMLHFVLPFLLALLVWKRRPSFYWRYVMTFVLVSFAGFLTFLIFPAAPPWLASDHHLIPHITHISGNVWAALGVHDFPSLYNKISPNIVAAMPSLHAAYSTLVATFVIRLFKGWQRWLVLVYPFAIFFGTVFMGEHYVIDLVAGVLYAAGAYWAAPHVLRQLKRGLRVIGNRVKN
jgi:membrane-associated phospholipid phosphatase